MRLTRAELLRVARALPEDLDALERQKIIVPVYDWVLFNRTGPWYTEAHFQVLRQYTRSRRALERNRRLTYLPAGAT